MRRRRRKRINMAGEIVHASNAAATEVVKGHRGRPFAKGGDPRSGAGFSGADDPRRNNNGQINKIALRFGKNLRDMLVEEGMKKYDPNSADSKMRIQRVVERIYDEAELGEAWAVQLIFERCEGKVTQPIEANSNMPVIILTGGASMEDI